MICDIYIYTITWMPPTRTVHVYTPGADKGGIIVRQSESLKSADLGRVRVSLGRVREVGEGTTGEKKGGFPGPKKQLEVGRYNYNPTYKDV